MRLEVYSRRQGHNDSYLIDKISTGWNVNHIAIGGPCDKRGDPYLFRNLEHDSINYPEDLGGYLEYLWDQADAAGMSDAQIQVHLDELGAWIQATEKGTPPGLWDPYK